MTRSSTLSLFPDVNEWLSLTYGRHIHHQIARAWFDSVGPDEGICFCRFTQLSLLRLLTTEAIMGADGVMTQNHAWEAYDRWLADDRIDFLEEPPNLDVVFRSLSYHRKPRPKTWTDSYLAAFAIVSGLKFVTFDQGFEGKVPQLLTLTPQG
jgi:uncharacterized protein